MAESCVTRVSEYALPATVYAVSILFFSVDGTEHLVSTQILITSGDNPLTTDELFNRARKQFEAEYDAAQLGPRSKWEERTMSHGHVKVGA